MQTALVRLLISLLSRSSMLPPLTFLASSLGNARKVSASSRPFSSVSIALGHFSLYWFANSCARCFTITRSVVIQMPLSRPAKRSFSLCGNAGRKSLYVLVKNKTQKEVVAAIKRARRRVGGDFSEVFKTITADNGSEFLDSESIKKAAKCGEIYYAHPYSSWERGSNENGNRILRRFVPKGTDIGQLTVKDLQRIEDWVNDYPRNLHGYRTANEMAA